MRFLIFTFLFSLCGVFVHHLHAQCASVTILNIDDLTATSSCVDGKADYSITVDVTVTNAGNTSACFDYYLDDLLTRVCWNKGTSLTDYTFTFTADCDSPFLLSGWTSPGGGGSQCFGPGASPVNRNNPLPVELLYVKAAWEGEVAQLEWATATEENFSHFEIHELDLITNRWLPIAKVNGAGENTVEEQRYSFEDRTTRNKNYYRIKMIDLDYTFEWSPIVSLTKKSKGLEINIVPNPNNGHFVFNLQADEIKSDYQLQIVDLQGKVVFAREINYLDQNEFLSFPIDLSGFPSGMYFYQLTNGTRIETGRIQTLFD